MKKLILLAATAFALFSCENGKDDGVPEVKTKNVVVKFDSGALTRSTEGAVASGDKVSIGNYTIFFLDAAGNVVKGTKSGDTAPGANAVACTDVGEKAVSVYVVANVKNVSGLDLSGIIPESSSLADIKAKVAEISTQSTIGSVVLANSTKTDNGKIIITNTAGTITYAAAVEVAPAICRLEIGQICGTGTGTGSISGFTLEGIYIDNHAVKFNIGGGYDETVTATHTVKGMYSIGVDNTLLTGYPSNFSDVAQMNATQSGSDFVVAPADSKIWAYQLAAGADMPKIIVKLSNVNGEGADKFKYVTVTDYKNGGATYSKLVPGTIYKIEKISFEMKSTAEVPNAKEKQVDVTVSVKGWEVVNLTPEV